MLPFGAKSKVCGSFACGSGIGYSVTLPVLGSSFPMYALKFAVNQMFLSWSGTKPCGPDPGVFKRYSLNCCVLGSNRPSTLAICPVYQTEPSGANAGSCGLEPAVGTCHSLIATSTLPGIKTASGAGLSGKFLAR